MTVFRALPVLAFLSLSVAVAASGGQDKPLPGDIPEKFALPSELLDYERQEVMIPMRDGVRLFAVIWRPKYASGSLPIVLTRTPYDAAHRPSWTARPNSPRGAAAVPLPDSLLMENGYIRVFQDVRGKYGSEGDYTMVMPPRGPLNAGPVDQSTDAWDTIDWLVRNVPDNNGRVGLIGVSYEGWTVLMALLEPHPALKAAIPMNAMVDGWMGDDWYHNGAFRQFSVEYVFRQTTEKEAGEFPLGSRDAYAAYLRGGSAAAMARSRGMDQLPAWKKIIDNPAYTVFWQEQAVDRLLARKAHVSVPTLTVHGLFDQEDIYGPLASYRALEAKDAANDRNFLVIGPWFHGQQDPWFHVESGTHLGPIQWGSDTTHTYLNDVMLPFFDRYLKDVEPKTSIPPVRAFETGSNRWRTYEAWPPPPARLRRLHFREQGRLSFDAGAKGGFDEFISEPAKPVPYRVPPIVPNDSPDSSWRRWLVDDQRPFSTRPDVLTWVSDPMIAPVTIAGEITAHLVASTSGTDSDWVVKLIDVYPDEYPMQPELGGYQLMVSADIFRGRYRESFEVARPISPDKPLPYRIRLPQAHHTFRAGHRIMIQVQSSWFPLYDRNPQTFVENIAYAPPEAYRPARQRIYHSSFVEFQVRPNDR